MLKPLFFSFLQIVTIFITIQPFKYFSCLRTAFFKSSPLTILYLSKTDRVLWPEIFTAIPSEIPALTIFLAAVRGKS